MDVRDIDFVLLGIASPANAAAWKDLQTGRRANKRPEDKGLFGFVIKVNPDPSAFAEFAYKIRERVQKIGERRSFLHVEIGLKAHQGFFVNSSHRLLPNSSYGR